MGQRRPTYGQRIPSVAAVLLGALAMACSKTHETSAIDRLKPCRAVDGPTDGYCGRLDVFEDRHAGTGRKISLNMVVLPALKQTSAPDPLFVLAGGPGEGAAGLAGETQELFRSIEAGRDIVLVDQRGTGKSNPLDCKAEREADPGNSTTVFIDRLHSCLDTYSPKADVSKYTTDIAMDDLDDVRQFLGYATINLYGGSYGTRAAIVYARSHRDHTRAVILDSVVPTDMRIPLYWARDSQRALDLLIRDCEKDSGCNRRFPNLRQRLEALLDRLAAHPEHIRYTDPRTGLNGEMDVHRLTFTGTLFTALYSPTSAAVIPLLVEQAEQGNFGGVLALRASFDVLAQRIAFGLQFSVLCSEDASRITPGSVKPEARGTFLGSEMAEARLTPCEFWPRAVMDPSYFAASASDVPALILSGELDPVTPPLWGEQVASQWKDSRHIVVPATGHITASAGCVMKLMTRFLNDGSASTLDVSCLDRLKRPPFVLGPSGPE
jgi:pimeloyl-ACP methyl ester carboxylesterase